MDNCKGCQLLKCNKGGKNQDDHYGGCIPNWVETEDVWAILGKKEPGPITDLTKQVSNIDIQKHSFDIVYC